MSDEIKKTEEANEAVAENAAEEKSAESKSEGVASSIKGAFSSLFSKASEIGNSVAEIASKKFEEGKEFVDDKIRERDANEIYRKLGKKVCKLVKRGELSLPESCQQYIDAINDLYGDDACDDDDADKCSCDDKCCCDGKCDCDANKDA